MKSNIPTMDKLMKQLQDEASRHHDFEAPPQRVQIDRDGLLVLGEQRYEMNDIARQQAADRLGIPFKFSERLRGELPDLYRDTFNTIAHLPANKEWLVRCLDDRDHCVEGRHGIARAVLSSAYKPYDNTLAIEALAAAVSDRMGLEVKSQSLTDTRMYIQAVDATNKRTIMVNTPNYRGERERVLWAGFTFSNSEVGMGAFALRFMIFNQWCSNMATAAYMIRKTHVGSRFTADDVKTWASREAIVADQAAMKLALRDATREALNGKLLDEYAHKMQIAADPERAMHLPVGEVIERSRKRFKWSEEQSQGILDSLSRGGGDHSQFGLHSAMTDYAKSLEPDKAHELETASIDMLELREGEWAALAGRAA